MHYATRNPAIRAVLADLVLDRQNYLRLERRLLKTLPRFLVESGWARFRVRVGAGGPLPE
jgi:hypothetical protein